MTAFCPDLIWNPSWQIFNCLYGPLRNNDWPEMTIVALWIVGGGEFKAERHNDVTAEFRSMRMDWTGEFRRHTAGRWLPRGVGDRQGSEHVAFRILGFGVSHFPIEGSANGHSLPTWSINLPLHSGLQSQVWQEWSRACSYQLVLYRSSWNPFRNCKDEPWHEPYLFFYKQAARPLDISHAVIKLPLTTAEVGIRVTADDICRHSEPEFPVRRRGRIWLRPLIFFPCWKSSSYWCERQR